jgi:hypothetical protein
MALTKTVVDDKIEIVSDYKHLQVRTATIIKEDDKELNRSFERRVIHCGSLDSSDNFVDTNMTSESTELQGIASTVWTQSVKDAYKAHLIAGD